MTTLYKTVARLCMCSAVFAAILSVLAASPNARADESETCSSCCSAQGYTGQMWEYCVSQCLQGNGPCGLTIKYRSKCPNGDNKNCSLADGAPTNCPGLLCAEPKMWACVCVYDANANKCNCPK